MCVSVQCVWKAMEQFDNGLVLYSKNVHQHCFNSLFAHFYKTLSINTHNDFD